MATFCFQCVTSFLEIKKQRNMNYIQDQAQICHRELFIGPEFKFIKNFIVIKNFQFDVTMMKHQNTYISETEKVYDVIMTSFFNQNT